MLSKDIWATNVYTLGYEYGSFANLDFTHKLIIANGSGLNGNKLPTVPGLNGNFSLK